MVIVKFVSISAILLVELQKCRQRGDLEVIRAAKKREFPIPYSAFGHSPLDVQRQIEHSKLVNVKIVEEVYIGSS